MAALDCVYCENGDEHEHTGSCSGCDMYMMIPDYRLIFDPDDLERFYCLMCQSWLTDKHRAAEAVSNDAGDPNFEKIMISFFGCNNRTAIKQIVLNDFNANTRMDYFRLRGKIFDRINEIRWNKEIDFFLEE